MFGLQNMSKWVKEWTQTGFLSAPSFSTGASCSTAVFSALQDEGRHLSDHETPPPTETSNSTPFSTAPPSWAPSPPQIIPRTRSASVLSEPTDDPDEASPPLIQVDNSDEEMEEDEDPNDWDAVVLLPVLKLHTNGMKGMGIGLHEGFGLWHIIIRSLRSSQQRQEVEEPILSHF
ncbi:hypothetical protein B0H13DRAFT_1857162 [Mycena leptocephala]|nr:hypothetical protein B0H13DRAFT_1857162 [Mycena leptocephala]